MLKRGRRPRAEQRAVQSAERGQVLILWILVATVILVIGAIVIDVGLWLSERRKVQLAADFAALAAASELSNGFTQVEARAREFAQRNGFEHGVNGVTVEVITPYDNDEGRVEVKIKEDSPGGLTRIFDAGGFDIGARSVGTLGGEPGPLDVVMILDRTSSMSQANLDNAKDAAEWALRVFDPTLQRVALGVIAAADPNDPRRCRAANPGQWIPVPLSDDYRDVDGNLIDSSALVSTIRCLQLAVNVGGTNLGDPTLRATEVLAGGRANAKKVIILLTDGQANQPGGTPCLYARNAADVAKNSGVELYTIGFGLSSSSGVIRCSSEGTMYDNRPVTELLANMATDSLDDNNNCQSASDMDAENGDDDNFFCEAKSESLAPIFVQIAEDLTQCCRLDE